MPRRTSYNHPNLYDDDAVGPVLDLEREEFVSPSPEKVEPIVKIYDDFRKYFEDLREFGKVRRALKIPEFSYPTVSFPSRTYAPYDLLPFILWSREFYEVRWWVNPISALLNIAIADPDLTEKAGWDFYVKAKVLPGYDSLHYASWWEFCHYGVQIPPDWKLEVTTHLPSNLIRCTSPDGKLGMVIGGV